MTYTSNYIQRITVCLSAGLLLLFLTACQDDLGIRTSTSDQQKQGGIRVGIDNSRPFSMTRAKLVDSPGISMDVEWEAQDAVGVYSEKGSNLQYTLAADDIESNNIGTFRHEAGTPEGEFYAYFPYESTASGNLESGLVLTMPATQELNLDGAKPMPDDLASAMAGKGNAGNVTLHSMHAILKVGYVAMDSVDVMKSITFRDLSGKPVSGRYTVALDEQGYPNATFPASGSNADGLITLECDSNYSTVTDSDLRTFYIVVPARDYPQGFELTFYLKSGKSESKSIGKLAGKTLQRATVYPVGEVSIIREGTYTMEFNGEGFMMTEDQLALVENIWSIDENTANQFYEPDRSNYSYKLTDMNLMVQRGPSKFAMVVDKRLDIREDMTIVINRTSEALPYGLIAKVTAVDKQGDNQLYVEMQRYAHIEGAFKKLQMGATRYSADGTPLDGESIDLGLDDGQLLAAPENPANAEDAVPYDSITVVPDSIMGSFDYTGVPVAPEDSLGETGEDETSVSGAAPARAQRTASPRRIYKHGSNTFSINRVSFLLKNDEDRNQKLMIGATASLGTYISVDVEDMQLNHLFMRFTPSLDIDLVAQMTWDAKKEGTIKDETKATKTWDLAHFFFAPITVGPLVFVPECIASVGGEFGVQMTLSAKWHYRAALEFEMKYYRLYKKDDSNSWFNWNGVQYDEYIQGAIRNKSQDPSWSRLVPQISVDMGLYATGSLSVNFGVGVYGLIGIDAYIKPSVTAGVWVNAFHAKNGIPLFNGKISLTPGLEYGMRVANKNIPFGEVDMNPLWERSIFPTLTGLYNKGPLRHDLGSFKIDASNGDWQEISKQYTNIPIKAELEGQTFGDMQLRWKLAWGTFIPGSTYIDAGTYSKSVDKGEVSSTVKWDASRYYDDVSKTIRRFPNSRAFSEWHNLKYQPFQMWSPNMAYITLEGRYGSNGTWFAIPWTSHYGEVRLGYWADMARAEEEKDDDGYGTGIWKGKGWGVAVSDDKGGWYTRDRGTEEYPAGYWDYMEWDD